MLMKSLLLPFGCFYFVCYLFGFYEKIISPTRIATVMKGLILRLGQVLLSWPGCPRAHYVDQASLQHTEIGLSLPFKICECVYMCMHARVHVCFVNFCQRCLGESVRSPGSAVI